MRRRLHPAKRRFIGRFPAPAPTPDGFAFNEASWLERASAISARAAERMGNYDALPDAQRQRMRAAVEQSVGDVRPQR